MKNFKDDIVVALKGYAMGAANVIPGVSGGTIALITGIFSHIVRCLNSLASVHSLNMLRKGQFRQLWERIDGRFLVALMVGVLVSIFSLAKVMQYVMAWYPIQTWAFFFGMIAASAVVMLVGVRHWRLKDILVAVAGGVIGVVVCTLSPTQTPDDMWFIFVCGAIAICTMILPGISGSFVLLILGKYEYIMSAVSNLNWPVLIVFAVGCVIGLAAFTKLLHWLLEHHERPTMLILTGFVLGSLVKVWPWNDPSAIVESQFLHAGMSAEQAEAAVSALASASEPIRSYITDFHVNSAFIWALAGILLVGVLEWLGSRNKAEN